MKTRRILFLSILTAFCTSWVVGAQTGPYPPTAWPASRDAAKTVHYFVVGDGGLEAPSGTWTPTLNPLSGGDQVTEDVTIGGFPAKKVTGNYLNVADDEFQAWAEVEFLDILVQAYGDGALFNAQGAPRDFTFLTGVLPELAFPSGGQVPVEARNRKWNWILFRIPNGLRADGTRFIGSIPANGQGASGKGGVNGGTIRFEGVRNLIVRAVAFGPEGAFGTPDDINQFFPVDAICDPEPAGNLVTLDVNAQTASHVEVLNDQDQTVTFETNVGPAQDRRRAVRPVGTFLNFGITDTFLGKPCNDPRTVKVCVEFYDDPAFAGMEVRFGPEAYATDDQGGIAFVPASKRHVMQGTGQWIRRSWFVPALNLKGVNAGAYTAGPRFISENGAVAVSSFKLAVIRTGVHPLANQDPLADCFQDPAVCTEAYGSFAELDLGKDIRNGLDVGSSGGDQEMVVDLAGPENDRRQAVRAALDSGTPGFGHQFLNFAITGEALGPTSQDPARLAICLTYYDDPELTGSTLRPEVYQSESLGAEGLAFTPGNVAIVLEGTGTWRDAYWEIPDMKFTGVNQGPQAAARFVTNGKIFITRLRYAVIRPCGANAGRNLLEGCKPKVTDVTLSVVRTADGRVRLAWPAAAEGYVLQSTPALGGTWEAVSDAAAAEGEQWVVSVAPSGTRFYRLQRP
ncbi:MAG: hypothetical protein IT580_13310 [Verrucomicrobiales bacterium]|nr:hypothetical protein [Verrucomicrobiales bacterium]